MRYDCELIQDLLLLYVDDTLSDYSRAIVETHLTSCKDCQADLDDIRQDYGKAEEELQEYQAEVCAFSRLTSADDSGYDRYLPCNGDNVLNINSTSDTGTL